jgi:hypothetical protein
VGTDRSGIHNQHVEIGVTQNRQDWVPASGLGPSVEPPPLAVAFAQAFGKILPGGSSAGNPQDGIDEASVILGDATMLSHLAGQQGLDAIPIRIRKLVSVSHDQPSWA